MELDATPLASAPRFGKSRNPLDRFMAKVEVGVCMEWTGAKVGRGYGGFTDCRRYWAAHRWLWSYLYGPIPDGMTLDHLCRNTRCVDPTHLRLLSGYDNTMAGYNPAAQNRRKTHCKRGHEFTATNTLRHNDGRRECRTCISDRLARLQRRRAELRVEWLASKTHCPRGHAYDDLNTYRTPSGKRNCRECRRAAGRRYVERSAMT